MELRTDRFKLKDSLPELAKKYAQKLHKKADEIDYIRKAIPIDPADISIDAGERAAIRLITTPHLDRDSEILMPGGAMLDDFRASPSVLYAHDYRGLPIGKDLWIKTTPKGILAKTQYANHAFAEDVYQCVKGGFLNSNSVGFIPVEAVDAGDTKNFEGLQQVLEKDHGIARDESGKAKTIYTKWIMLEHSDVPVPSNAQSLNLAVSKGDLNIVSEQLRKDLEIKSVEEAPAPAVVEDVLEEMEKRASIGSMIIKADVIIGGDVITKPETTDQYHRIPVDSGDHSDHRIRTITISDKEGVKALYCGECKKVITYLFDVDKWSMEEAKKWVEAHKEGKGIEYHEQCIYEKELLTDLKEKAAKIINALGEEQSDTEEPDAEFIEGFTMGYDLAILEGRAKEFAEAKEGRVLSTKNRDLVKGCADMLLELYNATDPVPREEPPKEAVKVETKAAEELPKPVDQKIELLAIIKSGEFQKMVNEAVRVAWAKLRGKVE